MINKILLTVLLLISLGGLTKAQDAHSAYLIPEFGFWSFSNKMKGSEYIRQDLASYNLYNGSSSSNLSSSLNVTYAGLKYQYYLSSRVGLAIGVRYSNIKTSIEKKNSDGASYFYFRLSQNGTDTEFIRLTKIAYSSNCLGIPIEATYNFKLLNSLSLFLKAGIDLSYSYKIDNDISFSRGSMKIYKDDVLNVYGTPSKFNSYIYSGGGCHLGKPGKPSINIELNLPAFLLTSKTSTLVSPNGGAGAQVSLLFPLNKSQE